LKLILEKLELLLFISWKGSILRNGGAAWGWHDSH